MVQNIMKLLCIIVCSLHLVCSRHKVIKNVFEGDASDKRFLDNVVNEKRDLLSRRPEIEETGAGFCEFAFFSFVQGVPSACGLSWVDLNFKCPTVCPILPGLEIWQNLLCN